MLKCNRSINSYRRLRSLRPPGKNVNYPAGLWADLTAGSGTSEEALEVIGAAFHQRVELRIQHWISLLPIGAEKLDSELTAFRILEANDLSFGHLWRRYDDAVIDFIILDRNLLNISHVIGCR